MQKDLNKHRLILDEIDKKLLELFLKRYEILKDIKEYKKKNNLPLKDIEREANHLEELLKDTNNPNLKVYLASNFQRLFANSNVVYRSNKIGLIGSNIKKSPSHKLHKLIARNLNLEYEFEGIQTDNLDCKQIIEKLKNGEFTAFFITMPYKKTLIKHLDIITASASQIDAINYIYYDGKYVIGANTDFIGFAFDFTKDLTLSKKITPFIMGDGASARSCAYALKKLGYKEPIFVSLKPHGYNQIDYEMLENIKPLVLINATPVGMYGDKNTLVSSDCIRRCKFLYDLVNYPFITSHTKLVNKSKNGLGMLIYQALFAIMDIFKIDFDVEEEFKKIYEEMKND